MLVMPPIFEKFAGKSAKNIKEDRRKYCVTDKRWVTNHFGPMFSTTHKWVRGRPAATCHYTAEQLEAWGVYGVYFNHKWWQLPLMN